MRKANLLKIIKSPATVLTSYWILVSQDTTFFHDFLDSTNQKIVQSNQKLISTFINWN